MVTGVRLSTKPSKIVTGHEPEKTNELLQAIARCIRKNVGETMLSYVSIYGDITDYNDLL